MRAKHTTLSADSGNTVFAMDWRCYSSGQPGACARTSKGGGAVVMIHINMVHQKCDCVSGDAILVA